MAPQAEPTEKKAMELLQSMSIDDQKLEKADKLAKGGLEDDDDIEDESGEMRKLM